MRKNRTFGAEQRLRKGIQSNFYLHESALSAAGIGNGDMDHSHTKFDTWLLPASITCFDNLCQIGKRLLWFGNVFGLFVTADETEALISAFGPDYASKVKVVNPVAKARFDAFLDVFVNSCDDGEDEENTRNKLVDIAKDTEIPLPCERNIFQCVGVYAQRDFDSFSPRLDYSIKYTSFMCHHISPMLEEWNELQRHAWHYGFNFDKSVMEFVSYVDWGHPTYPCKQDESVLYDVNSKSEHFWSNYSERAYLIEQYDQDLLSGRESEVEIPPGNDDDLLPQGVVPNVDEQYL